MCMSNFQVTSRSSVMEVALVQSAKSSETSVYCRPMYIQAPKKAQMA